MPRSVAAVVLFLLGQAGGSNNVSCTTKIELWPFGLPDGPRGALCVHRASRAPLLPRGPAHARFPSPAPAKPARPAAYEYLIGANAYWMPASVVFNEAGSVHAALDGLQVRAWCV